MRIETGNNRLVKRFTLDCKSKLEVSATLYGSYGCSSSNIYSVSACLRRTKDKGFKYVDPKDYPDQCKEVLNELWESLKPDWEKGQ